MGSTRVGSHRSGLILLAIVKFCLNFFFFLDEELIEWGKWKLEESMPVLCFKNGLRMSCSRVFS